MCLAHLDAAQRVAHHAALSPGADLDHRGTPFTQGLLDELLAALRDPTSGRHLVGRAAFDEARFSGDVQFERVDFTDEVSFGRARFDGGVCFRATRFGSDARFGEMVVAEDTWFDGSDMHAGVWFRQAVLGGALRFQVAEVGGRAVFDGLTAGGDAEFTGVEFREVAGFTGVAVEGEAWFDGTVFHGEARFARASIAQKAWFDGAVFRQAADFAGATLGQDVSFSDARFERGAGFREANIGGDAEFHRTGIEGDVVFRKATFLRTARLGPLVCAGLLDLSEAVFHSAVTIEAAAKDLRCRRTRWGSTAALRLRHAAVDFGDAVLEFPVSVAGRSRPFVSDDGTQPDEPGLTDPRVRVTSLRGTDAAHLVLADVDLTDCLFAETVHLDQLRLEGRCPLPEVPAGIHRRRWLPVRWTRRRTLIEEHHWRAARQHTHGWTPAPADTDIREPAALAPVYRQLRKALEDGKNEPGAADFYYGEMEMRRHDRESPWGERALLLLYWAASGYGLRATRALGWLLLAMTATVLAMMVWGVPKDDPAPRSTGQLTGTGFTLTTDKADPVNPEGPYGRRLSDERFEKSLRVVINSVVFRSSGQDLTTAGTYIEMTSRILEPALIGLTLLAVRGRVKR
ncbi:pentapeptide repeat-containing protein [Streptomyces exfoliatus]|uniref:pentapeptide repeat-containing protein n=1 Tax=Streptomyces exfoliatus TaxID=1905 RepID=UPI003C2D7B55